MPSIKAVLAESPLCDDVAEYIENIVIRKRMTDIHAEYFNKLAGFFENKIDALNLDIWTHYRNSPYDNHDHLTGDPKYDLWYSGLVSKHNESCVLAQLLDDIFYNSGKIVDSEYRGIPDFDAIFEDISNE